MHAKIKKYTKKSKKDKKTYQGTGKVKSYEYKKILYILNLYILQL